MVRISTYCLRNGDGQRISYLFDYEQCVCFDRRKIKLKDVRDMQLDRGNKFLVIHAHDEKRITRELDCRFVESLVDFLRHV